MNALQSCETEGDVRDALGNLAKGENKLDQAYAQTMIRIQSQEECSKQLATRSLTWIVHAKRQLSIEELQHALAVRPNTSRLDQSYCPRVKRLLSVCAGLVRLDEKSQIIDLVHKTTRDYFDLNKRTWFPDAESDITTASVTYLPFDAFQRGLCKTNEEFWERLQSNLLYGYVARNWGHHAREALTSFQVVMEFLQKRTQVEASSEVLQRAWLFRGGKIQEVSKRMSPLHLATFFGLEAAVRLLLEQGADLAVVDSSKFTPLHYTSRNGHLEVGRLPLDHGADVTATSEYGETPLHIASEKGHLEVVKLLLDHGANVTATTQHGETPLHEASYEGLLEVVRLLLGQGADITATNDLKQTPISIAIDKCHLEVVRLLLDQDTKVTVGALNDALDHAVDNGHHEIVQLLLAHGADIAAVVFPRSTLLHLASFKGHVEVAQVLLEHGANAHALDRDGRTVLDVVSTYAPYDNHKALVRLLLDKGAKYSEINVCT
jgi:ankyrin repeat protein